MRGIVIICWIVLIFTNNLFSQSNERKYIDDNKLKLINNLSSTIKDTSIIIDPIIEFENVSSLVDKAELIKKYKFSKNQLENIRKDTLYMKDNLFFKVMNPDTLIKYRTIKLNEIIIGQAFYLIKKYYQKSCFLSFKNPLISSDKKYALIEYFICCGPLNGWGEFCLMKYVNHKWIKFETLYMIDS